MKRLALLVLTALAAVSCRDREVTAPESAPAAVRLAPPATAAPATTDAYVVYLSSHYDSTVYVHGVPSNTLLASIKISSWPGFIAASPDGQRVYVVQGYRNRVAVVRTSDNTVIADLSTGGTDIGGAVVSPDNQRVYIGSRDGYVYVLDATTLQFLPRIATGIAAFMVDITPDGGHLYVTNNSGSNVAVIDLATRTVEKYITTAYRPWGVDVTNDGQFAYVANSHGGSVSKISTSTNTVVATIPLVGMPYVISVATTPDGQKVFVGHGMVSVLSIPTDQVIATTAVGKAYFTKVTPDGAFVYVTRDDQGVDVLDASTYAVVGHIPIAYANAGIAFVPAPPQPTAATITSSANPAVTGQAVDFTATVTSSGTPVAAGSVTFKLGGTACADAPTVLAGPLPLNANGQATTTHGFLATGSPYAVRACYGGTTAHPRYYASEAALSQVVNAAPVAVTAAVTPATQQYSDAVVPGATLALEAGALAGETLTGSLTFFLDGTPMGSTTVSTTTLPVTVEITAQALAKAAGAYVVSAVFTSTNGNFVPGTTTDAPLSVTAEDATVTPDAANPTQVRVTAPFGTSGPLTLAFAVSERYPELNADPDLALPGNLGLRVEAQVVLTPAGGGTAITVPCTGGSVSGTGYGQQQPFSCTTPGLAPATYDAVMQVLAASSGRYYAGSETRMLRVYDPSADIAALRAEVSALAADGTLKPGNANALIGKLDAALAAIARGQDNVAVNNLKLFISQVEGLVRTGKLAPTIGDHLITEANAIITDLQR